jgi:thymidylate kinase
MSRRGMVITFSGLDGAGKSTLIGWLEGELERQHRPVTVLHMADGVGLYAGLRAARDSLQRLMGRRNVRKSDRPRWAGPPPACGLLGLAHRIRHAILWSKPLRRVVYPLDLLIFLVIRFYVATVRGRVLLTDRYFYDTLVDVADDGRWFWVRLLERLTPAPDVPVFLDVSPEESYARKGEYSVAYLARRSAAYRHIAPLIPSAVVLPNADLDDTRRALVRAIRARLDA